ncbi:MAG: diacylglycerol kinase family protein [Planctomycetaceae bacterium]
MKPNSPFSMVARYNSFRYAFRGAAVLVRTEHNTWGHALATIGVTAAGLYFGLTRLEWCAIALTIAGVWTAEAFNTAIEYLTDLVSPEYHPLAGKIKDVSAAAVLFAVIGSIVVGVLILGPHVMEVVRRALPY